MAMTMAKTKKITIDKKYLWDYELPKNWQPRTKGEWLWLLERKINHGDFKGLQKEVIKKYLPFIKRQLDPGKKMMLKAYFEIYG